MISKSTRFLILTLLVYIPTQSMANEQLQSNPVSTIPSPLSLQQALELLDPAHPDIQIANARLQSARADFLHTDSRTDIKSYLDLAAVRARPSITDKEINDSYAELIVTKTLYDFGQSNALSNSLSAAVISEENQLENARHKHQYEIMERFFNVLLADFRYVVDDEEMTQRFLKYDKKRERAELGILSDVEVQQAENLYREALDNRVASDKNQRSTRLMLALALNRPDELPAELIQPDLSYLSDDVPDAQVLYKQALNSNKDILAAQQRVDAAQQKLMAERAGNRPTLSAQLEFGEYEQQRASRDTASATLLLRIPLYQARESRANVDRASAQLFARKAELRKLEHRLLVNISTILKELSILKTRKQTANQRLHSRDLDLEHRRALYEMEVQTNMSEKQARLTEAQWQINKLDYEHALMLAQLNILMGNSPALHLETKSP